MKRHKRIISAFLAVLIFLGPNFTISAYAQPTGVNPPRTSMSLKPLVEALLNETPIDANDTDYDGLPDTIESIIGTDPNNTDSDFDRLGDYWEIYNGLDPLGPDSNFDGLPDYYEVKDLNSPDIDGDGIDNAWDFDNDGDGVNDGVDMSPFAKSDANDVFHFDITTNGNPAYMTFQLTPKSREHLKLFGQSWNWPDNDHSGSVQDWDNSKEDVAVYPTLQLTVNVPPAPNDVVLNGIAVDGNIVSVPLMPVTEHGNIVAFAGRMLYPTDTPQNLTVDAQLIWKIICRNDPNSSIIGQETLLATYNEGFALVGMTIEESYGTDAGLFYSPDVNETVAANLLMAYEFLRNSANHIADIPDVLDSNNVNVSHQLASFSHRDAALVSIANEMIPDALDSLPSDQNLPVIALLEDSSVSRSLAEFEPVGNSGNSFSVDLTTEPAMTTKTLKTSWYNTSERQAMQTGEVMAEIRRLGLGEVASYSLMTLMLYWNTGEQSLEGLGVPPTYPGDDFELVPDVVEDIVGGGLVGLEGLYRAGVGLAGLRSYQSIKLLQSKGWAVSMGGKSIPDIAKMGKFKKFKTWVKQCERIQDTSSFFKKMDKVLEGLDTAAMFADAGFAAYSVIALSQMSDLSGFALNNALMQTMMEYYYSLMLFMIGSIPYVGWIIAIGIELSDILGDWSDDLFNWFVSLISKVEYTVSPKIEQVGQFIVNVTDKDDNGLDTGDHILYTTRLKGTVSCDSWSLVTKSSINPYYWIYAPGGSSSPTGYTHWNQFVTPEGNRYLPMPPYAQWTRIKNSSGGWKSDEYDVGAWIEPNVPMVNFPVVMRGEAMYDLWYHWKYFVFLVFYGFWAHHDDWVDGFCSIGSFTLHFDVLPGSIDDFTRWRGITPLDHDADGLNDANEAGISNHWLYDSDGDGLNDNFEFGNVLNPKRHDTDGDGLIDWYEIQFGTEPNNPDTDGDGVLDYLEIAGWLIQFEYAGKTFTTRVYSDPAIPDTDSDGVDDNLEYKSNLNPRSKDTNGDGINDVANPIEEETVLELVTETEIPYGVSDIDVDANGFVYALVREHVKGKILKFDSDLNLIPTWTSDEEGDNMLDYGASIVIDDKKGLIHVGYKEGNRPSTSGITTFNLSDGTLVLPEPWAVELIDRYYQVIELDVDADGNVYVLRRGYECVEQHDPVYHWDLCFQYTNRAKVDIYDPNYMWIDTWGQYATLQHENYIGTSGYKTWHFYYVSEPNIFNDVQDLVVRDDGLVFISETGASEFFYEWRTMATGWLRVGEYKLRDDRIAEYDVAGQYYRDLFTFTDPNSGQQIFLDSPAGIATDENGYFYLVVDSTYIYKFDENLVPVATWTIDSWMQPHTFCEFGGCFEVQPPFRTRELIVDANNNIYTYFSIHGEVARLSVIEKYSQSVGGTTVIQDPSPDSDGDGLLNDDERAGWDVTFTDANSTQTVHSQSDPLLTDTDLDGLNDLQEYELGTNPQDPDTDDDGLSDFTEWQGQTDPKHFDTDLDGLPDGTETTYGSDPNSVDTDGEGLSDAEEFEIGSDPNSADTDGDGLDDANEMSFNTNLFSPDTDGDFMFDGREINSGTDPNNGDTDNDGLSDGMESCVYNTDPNNSDTDGDGVKDGEEIEKRLNPLSNDTDNDGIPDGKELEDGTNPWLEDSDHDGIPDNQDNTDNMDNMPPDVSGAHPNKEYLWPPNNKFVEITIEGVTDPNDDPVQILITEVTSDELSWFGHWGFSHWGFSHWCKNEPDAYISEDGALYLRAKRSGWGNGRVYEISFIAGDDKGGITPGKVQVKVPHHKKGNTYLCVDDGQKYTILSNIPNNPPDVNDAHPSKEYLWPPNHKFEKVSIEGVTDPDGDQVKIHITGVTSDEPSAFHFWHRHRRDAFISKTGDVYLRAERRRWGNGRVYEISFVAKDKNGGETPGKVGVKVPRSMHGGEVICIDDGQKYDILHRR